MPYEPIRRGSMSSALKYTKSGHQYCHIQRDCQFDDLFQTCVRSIFIWPRTDKHGNTYHILRVLTSTSMEGKKGQLVAPINRKLLSYRVNPNTGSVTALGYRKQFTVDLSLDHRLTTEEFKSVLLEKSRLANDLFVEYQEKMDSFW